MSDSSNSVSPVSSGSKFMNPFNFDQYGFDMQSTRRTKSLQALFKGLKFIHEFSIDIIFDPKRRLPAEHQPLFF